MNFNEVMTKEMQADAINLAMAIDTGTIDLDHVLSVLKQEDQEGVSTLVLFWYRFNDMTKSAVDRLCDYAKQKKLQKEKEEQIKFLEKCFDLDI